MSCTTIGLLIALAIAPVMAAAQTPPRFTVIFDVDSRMLNRAGHEIVDRAARQFLAPGATSSTARRYTQVALYGYTDATTSPEYALALSRSMAQAVADVLAQDGVSRSAMVIRAFGSDAAASGGDAADSRRVEIIFQ